MHFAAFTYVGEFVDEPLLYYRNNVAGTAALLEAVMNFKPLPVVFSSTCVTYGMPQSVPIPEDHPQNPINPYGLSKLFVEQMLVDCAHRTGCPGSRSAISTPPVPTRTANW